LSAPTVAEGTLLWSPTIQRASDSGLAHYLEWLSGQDAGLRFDDYNALWRWSVSRPAEFWGSLWKYFDVQSSAKYVSVLSGGMMDAKWFEGCRLNYAEHLLRHESRALPQELALLHTSEAGHVTGMTWGEFGAQVRRLAVALQELGVRPGDRIVAILPNVPQTVIAMVACVAVGAVWSTASPEFGAQTVIDRFRQIEPVMMIAVDGYVFGGRTFGRAEEIRQIASSLPTLRHVVCLEKLAKQGAGGLSSMCDTAGAAGSPKWLRWEALMDRPSLAASQFQFVRVTWNHPLWILFSSGTTGLPKAIVHGHAGMLLEHLKLLHLHMDLRPGARLFFYTTTGWMMWNVAVAALLSGATVVLYDGSPTHGTADRLWRIAAEGQVTHMGASPTFLQSQKAAGIHPCEDLDLHALEMITVSGSPCSPEHFSWIQESVKPDVWIASQSGGTEICSAFVGAVPTLPVYAGEIQARMLGMDVHSWSDTGAELLDEIGELVVTRPFPSMPLYFWNDVDRKRYTDSYFRYFSEVWRHGDYIKINGRGGCYIYGRSDSTLNRHGVRIGTAEVYRLVEKVPGVVDSLVVCSEVRSGTLQMLLFVVLSPGRSLDATLREVIELRLRQEGSPRHVPDVIAQVEAIPYTLTGKKMEVPVRRLLEGTPIDSAASRDAMANPDALDGFLRYRSTLVAQSDKPESESGLPR